MSYVLEVVRGTGTTTTMTWSSMSLAQKFEIVALPVALGIIFLTAAILGVVFGT